MAFSAAREGNSLERYISGVRSVWGDGKDSQLPYRVKGLLEKLLASTSPDEPWMAQLIREAKPARELYRDPDSGFIQMGHVHPEGHSNQPHDHGPCWVLYGVYRGEIEITQGINDDSPCGITSRRNQYIFCRVGIPRGEPQRRKGRQVRRNRKIFFFAVPSAEFILTKEGLRTGLARKSL